MRLRGHLATRWCIKSSLNLIGILTSSVVGAWSHRWSSPMSSKLHLVSTCRLDLSLSDVDDACTQLLRLCHRRCQYLANYVGSPPPITPAQLVLAIPFAAHWHHAAISIVKACSERAHKTNLGSESGRYNSWEIEDLYVPLRQRRDLVIQSSWV